MIDIEQITPELTSRLRRDVLYPEKDITDMEMNMDREGYHFGAFTDNKLVGVVSLFPDGKDLQFRKLAVDPAFQRRGVGSALLDHVESFALQNGGIRIWCNARTTATGFYLESGYGRTGRLFSKNGLEYEIMAKLVSCSGNQ